MGDCIFCRIVARQAPAHVVDENDAVIVFLSLENHPLVVPKRHLPDIFSLDDATAAAVMQEAVTIAKAVRLGLRCDGVYLTQANGAAAGQDVFHFHLHVYPRWHGDRRPDIAPGENVLDQLRRQTCDRIRAALTEVRAGSLEQSRPDSGRAGR
jgi:histidine triad (HIT) family protein